MIARGLYLFLIGKKKKKKVREMYLLFKRKYARLLKYSGKKYIFHSKIQIQEIR